MKIKLRFPRLAFDRCDRLGCKNKVYKSMQEMIDGAWIDLCRRHYREYRKANYPMKAIK